MDGIDRVSIWGDGWEKGSCYVKSWPVILTEEFSKIKVFHKVTILWWGLKTLQWKKCGFDYHGVFLRQVVKIIVTKWMAILLMVVKPLNGFAYHVCPFNAD